MTDDRINHPQVEQSVPGGDSDSGEEAAVPVVRAVGRFGRECEPYILPLFPLESEQMMGRDGDGGPPINQSVSQSVRYSVAQLPFHSTFQSEVRQYLLTQTLAQVGSLQSRDRTRFASAITFSTFFNLTFAVGTKVRRLIGASERRKRSRSVSWLCKAMGSDDVALHWRLPASSGMVVVREGDCDGRVCVDENVLTVRYLHPGDSGRYTCVAKNKYGQDQRQVALKVEVRKKE